VSFKMRRLPGPVKGYMDGLIEQQKAYYRVRAG